MHGRVALIGFGEAAMTFVEGVDSARSGLRAYDIKTAAPATREAKLADYRRLGVRGMESVREAVTGADLVLSLVTADQALAAAADAGASLDRGAIFCDMNSVAPGTKRAAAARVERAGGRYADAAVMAPVRPALRAVQVLVSGPHSAAAADALRTFGFANVEIVEGPVGASSAIKMIRSVMVKGIEALSAECFLAAAAAGVTAQVVASLDSSWPGADWAGRGDYNLGRMITHGGRRAAEMDEVATMLEGLGLTAGMARAAAEWQRAIGRLGILPPPGLAAKTAAILGCEPEAA